ncbi:hypothetical protein WMY93_005548 [Mugilogobius chulae]|uniref:Lipoxygenase domain-containing protein n=1 Tax=Mugilogobius chulae TaxID=88201 RepID=A0AAW0PH36_9GOBI
MGDSWNTRCHGRAWSRVHIKLKGEDGESKRTVENGFASIFEGKTTYNLSCSKSIGKLEVIELDFFLTEVFLDKVDVFSPEGQTYTFPIYQWIKDTEIHRFREGTALIPELDSALGKSTRAAELEERKKIYCWTKYRKGLPHCMKAKDVNALPWEVQFSFQKTAEILEMNLKLEAECQDNWESFDAIKKILHPHQTPVTVPKWFEPYVIRRCQSLPKNFPVSEEMLFLDGAKGVERELQEGNIFLCDYKVLDGLKANVINDKQQYLVAPLVLLHKTPQNELKPIAIQLKQTAGEDNPIFYPNDSEYDWLLAKTFVRSAYFNEHELKHPPAAHSPAG